MSIIGTGTILNDRYSIKSEIGHGGMGIVFLAHDDLLQRDVAVKVLTTAGLGAEGRSHLLHEAQAIAMLNHPNIVTVHDAGEVEEIPYIVMEYIEGKNLHEASFKDIPEMIPIVQQVCAALEHAHQHGIIHRDLKPENIIITPEGIAKLMDFGLARSFTSRYTQDGTISGTAFYMAPEFALGSDFDGRADLYALGVMLYELTTGELPFKDTDPLGVISQHLHAPVVPPRAKNERIPPLFEQLVLQLLCKDPEDRPASPIEVLDLLKSPNLLDSEASVGSEPMVLERIAHGRIVGRESEIERARDLWSRTLSGEGQLLLISGEPGIGKTRLLREMTTHAEVTGGLTLVGESTYGGSAPYDAFTQIVHKGLEHASIKGIELSEFILADLLTLAPEFLTKYSDIPPSPSLDPESEQRRLMENLAVFINTLAEETPLLIAIDDAHWADSGTLAMLQHLVRRCKKQRVMILITYREVELDEALPFHETILALGREASPIRTKLSRFTETQTLHLLETIFAEEITPVFLSAIYQETEGNPFFIEEVSKALVESGNVYFEDGHWHRPEMEELEIPQSIRVAIQARVGRLPENDQEILRLAALIGREFEFEILVEASGEAEDSLIAALESAERAQLIRESNGQKEVTFQFTHALFASTLVESIRTLRRRRLHKQVATALERIRPTDFENLAFHFGESGSEEEALHYYTQAAERASAAFANQEAEGFFTAALDLVEGVQEEAHLLAQLGIVQNRIGKHRKAVETWKEAIEKFHSMDEEDQAAELYARCGRVCWDSGDTPGNLSYCQEGLGSIGDSTQGPGVAKLLAETGRACYFNNEIDEVEYYCRKALEMAEKHDAINVQADALITLGLLPDIPPEEAISYYERAIELAETAGFWGEAARAHNNLSTILSYSLGDIVSSKDHLLQAADLSHDMGAIGLELFYRSSATGWYLWIGEIAQVEAALPGLNELMEAAPESRYAIAMLRTVEANLHRHRGDLEKATSNFRELLENAKSIEDPQAISGITILLVDVLIETGNYREVKTLLEEVIEYGKSGGLYGSIVPRSYLATVYALENNFDMAQSILKEAQKDSDETTRAVEELYLMISKARVATAQQDWEVTLRVVEELKVLLEEYGFRWIRTRLLFEWSQACLIRSREVDIKQAKEMLKEAISEFMEMGSYPYAEKARALLEEAQSKSS